MNSSQEETFRSLMDYFGERRFRILVSDSPSYIRVGIGSWMSFSLESAKGEAEVNVTKRNGGSYVNLNFNFFKDYMADFLTAIIGAILVYAVPQWIVSLIAGDFVRWFQSRGFNLIFLGLSIVFFSLAMILAGYSTSLTRKRFIDEFNIFAQSLQPKK